VLGVSRSASIFRDDGYAALTHPTQDFGVVKFKILCSLEDTHSLRLYSFRIIEARGIELAFEKPDYKISLCRKT
jgi:hypothetical protein